MRNGVERRTVVLIDPDFQGYRERLTSLLSACLLVVFCDYREACEHLFHHRADIVLLSHDDPDGCVEMISFIKSVSPVLPVIVMTGRGSEAFAVAVFRAGARDYFRKPLEMDVFAERVCSVLGLNPVLRHGLSAGTKHVEGMERALEFVHEHYAANIRLPEVARIAGMSVSCFSRRFKREMEVSFTDYVNRFRIAKAVDLLRENGGSMSEIAFACGFTNQFHFSRTFRKVIRTTPSSYRRSLATK